MRNKIIGILIAILLIIPIVWSFFKFAPVPKNTNKKTKIDSKILSEQKNSNNESGRSDKQDSQYSLLMGLLGESVGKGTLNSSLESYCGEIENKYRQRGFKNYQEIADSLKNNRSGGLNKIYWSSCESPVGVVNAIGVGANLLSTETEKENSGSQYATIIEKKNNAVFWETYRIGKTNQNFDSGSDLPGEDPPFIPRINDSQRILGLNQAGKYTAIYQTGRDMQETLDWYKSEFAKLQFEKTEVPAADKGDLIFFTKDKYFFTLWLSKNEVDGKTTILITLQN